MSELLDNEASKMIDGVVDGSIDMKQRGHEIELRRILSQLDNANIPDSICEETPAKILRLMSEGWSGCREDRQYVLDFVREAKNWCRSGFRIVIDGGSERNRVRVMRYLLFRSIVARCDSMSVVVSTYDWLTVMPIVCDFKHPNRLAVVEGMRTAKILGLTEVDPTITMSPGIESVLTSILRGRTQSKKPTIVTLRNIFDSKRHSGAGEIHALAKSIHDPKEDKIVRIRLESTINE